MGHNPEIFSNADLAHIGREMAAHYRQTHNGKAPAKKEEKINDKHNSFVCVYGPADWSHLDGLIRERGKLRHLWPQEGGDEKSTEVAEVELHSIKDRVKHMNLDLQQLDNKDLIRIGKKMAEYFRNYTGKDPQKKEEKINDKHNSFVCVYGESDWEHLDYLITTTLKI